MRVLLLLDVQNDFAPFGALGVAEALDLVARANVLLDHPTFFDQRIATQNWHPAQHVSFAASHYFRYPGQVVDLKDGPAQQRLWPIYGVAESFGADLMPELHQERLDHIIKKGQDHTQSAYSAFAPSATPALLPLLQAATALYIGGFFTEYGIKETVLDALDLRPDGQIFVLKDLCAAKNWEHADEGAHCLAELAALNNVTIIEESQTLLPK